MECNKDEAKRAMDIAEKKITEKDYNGAKKFASKAQTLYPPLDGVKQLLMMVDVYLSGEKQVCGESDWYGILGVDPLADDEAVRKQYRKLALMLHPDKNKCKGAEGAFMLLSEAWSLLSDKARRFSYNLKRQVKEVQQKFPAPHMRPPPTNGFQNAREPVVPSGKPVVSSGKAKPKPKPAARMDKPSKAPPSSAARMDRPSKAPPSYVPPALKERTTFWTICDRCNTQYEYLMVYLNQTLLCPNCRLGFVAAERAPPPNAPKPVNLSSKQQKRSSNNQATNKKPHGSSLGREPAPPAANHSFRWDSVSTMGGSNSRNPSNLVPNVAQQAQDSLKRGFGESLERDAARGFTNSDLKNFKKPKTDGFNMSGPFSGKWSNQIGMGFGSWFSNPSNPAKGNTETPITTGFRRPNIQGMMLPGDITKALMNKAQSDIFDRLPKIIAKMAESVKVSEEQKKNMKAASKMSNKGNEAEKNSGPVEEIPRDAIVVPDSDFHIFDLDRAENCFKEDQIWAAYDDDDGMPRYYARIQKVISLNPFKMKISWLNTRSCSEFGSLDWVGSGFAKSCGDFRTGKYEPTDALNAFSHKVDFTKGARGVIHIYPKKGQVWALYRNWSPEWHKDTPDEIIHKYDMVEVLDDYTEDKLSLNVTLLLKEEGFKSVFRRSTDPNDVRIIPKEEMFRFSHQVPHWILNGDEGDNSPKGFLELDPAATHSELLSENGEAKETTKMEIDKSATAKEDAVMDLD